MEEFRKEKNESIIEGRNVVIEAFRSGQSIDRLYILDGCQDGPIMTIKREASYKICIKGTSGSDFRNREASGCYSNDCSL